MTKLKQLQAKLAELNKGRKLPKMDKILAIHQVEKQIDKIQARNKKYNDRRIKKNNGHKTEAMIFFLFSWAMASFWGVVAITNLPVWLFWIAIAILLLIRWIKLQTK